MKGNRLVNRDMSGNVTLESIGIPTRGRIVHLKVFYMVKVFKTVSKNGDVEYYATDDLGMKEKERDDLPDAAWGIEIYRRGIKQYCGVERSHVRMAVKQLAHITLSLRAFLRLEFERLGQSVSWYESKISVARGAISAYLSGPTLGLSGA